MEEELLERIERELVRIRNNTSTSWKWLVAQGLLRGAGFVIGTVLAVALIGWVLSLLGFIPGIGQIAHQLQQINQTRSGG